MGLLSRKDSQICTIPGLAPYAMLKLVEIAYGHRRPFESLFECAVRNVVHVLLPPFGAGEGGGGTYIRVHYYISGEQRGD